MVDPNWAVVCMLLAFVVGLVGGVRLTSNSGGGGSGGGGRMSR